MGISAVYPGYFDNWQLPASNYVSTSITGMPPVITYPRPDIETSQYAHHRNAYNDGSTSIRWEAPAVVQGGSWPFKYTVSAPTAAGLTIGSTLDIVGDHQEVGADYGVMSWESPTIGTHEITLTVIDQGGNTDSVVFNLVVGSTNFVFIDASATNDNGTGAIGNPLKTIQTGLWNNSDTDNSFVNKIAIFRAGSYETSENGVDAMEIDSTYKPMSYIAYSGESVTWDMSVNRLWIASPDLYIAGIDCDGYLTTATNWWAFAVRDNNPDADRLTWFKCTFDNMGHGTVHTDNPSVIQCRGKGDNDLRDYISVVRCTTKANCNCPTYVGFNVDHFVFEHNETLETALDGLGTNIYVKAKDEHHNCTIRSNTATKLTSLDGDIYVMSEQDGGVIIENQECCYNVGYCTDTLNGINKAICYDGGSVAPGYGSTNVHWYRNTGVHTHARGFWGTATEGDNALVLKNIFYGGSVPMYPEEPQTNFTNTDNVIDLVLTTDIDTDGNLVGTARTNYLGTHGYEVA